MSAPVRHASYLAMGFVMILLAPSALAYELDRDPSTAGDQVYKWCGTQGRGLKVYYSFSSPSSYLNTFKQAVAVMNQMGSRMYFLETGTSTNYDIRVDLIRDAASPNVAQETPESTTFGGTIGSVTTWCYVRTKIELNQAYMDALFASSEGHDAQSTMAHELGHALGLQHPVADTTLMYGNSNRYGLHKIIMPTPDDLEGLEAQGYLRRVSALNTSSLTTGGAINRYANGSISRVMVSIDGTSQYAYAHDSWTRGTNWRGSGATAEITPNVVYRGSLRIGPNSNPTDTTARVGSIELNDGGIRLSYTKPDNTLQISTISATPAAAGTKYWASLRWVPSETTADGAALYAHVYRESDNVLLGHLKIASVSQKYGSVAGTYRSGVAAWTDTSSNPNSEYSVNNGIVSVGAYAS